MTQFSDDPEFRRAVRERLEAIQRDAQLILPPGAHPQFKPPSFAKRLTDKEIVELAELLTTFSHSEKVRIYKYMESVAARLIVEIEELRLRQRSSASERGQ